MTVDAILQGVREETAALLGLGHADAVPTERPLREIGLDSVRAMALQGRLAARFGVEVPATVAFDHPTPRALADAVHDLLHPGRSRVPADPGTVDPDEPIAIVAMACRAHGGVTDPASLWDLLIAGRVATGPTPARWQPADPSLAVPHGGALDDVEAFDARFFDIVPEEARALDPQQRLALELAWETLERAGTVPASLAGTRTGVFLGASGSDYGRDDPALTSLNGYRATGQALSMLSGRVAYVLGLQGPALTVDTACSASLVALHLAACALRRGECALALAGGVQVWTTPAAFVEFDRLGALAPDGRCKPFGADADGTAWSEGGAMLLLQRLSDAEASGHPILAVLRGTAINHDGRSQGLTAPNGPSQQRVVRDALRRTGLGPDDLDAVEAHGTGTPLGDPIEAEALRAVFGPARRTPLHLGACKGNLGHTQAAAGALGVAKMVLALQHEQLPPTLHADPPSPHVRWDGTLSLCTEARPWVRQPERVRRAGVSAFGISGTNAHVVLEEAPAVDDPWFHEEPVGHHPIVLSGRTPEALRANAARLADHLARHPGLPLDAVAHGLATARTHFEHRGGWLCDPDDAAAGYPRLRAALTTPPPVQGFAGPGRVAVMFAGQGAVHPGMGQALYDQPGFEAFTDALDEAVEACAPHLPVPLLDRMWPADREAGAAALVDTRIAQPALFVLETALFRQWAARGLRPSLVFGHSVGEITACHVAGVLSLADAARLVCVRGRLLGDLDGAGGAMVAVRAAASDVVAAIARLALAGVDLAADNAPTRTVVSGDADAVDRLVAALGVEARRLRVSHAFHAARVAPALDALRQLGDTIPVTTGHTPVLSSRTGRRLDPATLDGEHWARQAREPVRFRACVEAARAAGTDLLVACGPTAGLAALAQASAGADAVCLPSLRASRPATETLLEGLLTLHAHGHAMDLGSLYPEPPPPVTLPTYAFQRRRFWLGDAGTDAVPLHQLSLVPTAAPCDDLAAWPRVSPADLGTAAKVCLDLTTSAARDPAVLVAELIAALQRRPPPDHLVVLTSGALPVPSDAVRPDHAAVWRLLRVLRSETPDLRLDLVDTDGSVPPAASPSGGEWRVREGAWARAELTPLPSGADGTVDPGGTVVITGGTGGLGPALATHLVVRHGVRHLLLLSRSGALRDLEAALRARGAQTVTVQRCDVADADTRAASLGTIPADRAPSAVFHLAGRHDDAPLHAHTAAQVHDVFAGKVGGARTLAAWVPDAVPLVFFSSVSGLLGAPGQAAYAAANAALDAVAAERRQRGGHALSLAWGPWSEAGMFASLPDGLRARLAHRLPPHGLREGFAALDRALAHPGALLAAFSPPPSTVRRPLREQLYTTLERLLGRPAPPDRDVRELGLDSLGVLELHRSLGEALGASVDLRTLDDWRPDAILAALETPPPVVAVAAQCLPLCAEDDMPHNTASVVFTSRPVDAAAFRRALGTALQRFPHLAGRLQGDASARTFFVGPGPGDVPLDVVRDDAPLDVHGFSALSAAELEARFVPGFPAGTIDALNEDRPLAALQLTQLPGAAVLGVCVSHLLLDATGAWLFYETLRCALAGQDLPDITRDRGVVPGVGPWQPTTVSPPPWYRALSHEACADVDVAERRRAADDPLVTFTLAREAVPEGTDPWRAVAGTLWAWAVEAAQLPQSELAIWHDIRGRSGSPVPFHYTGNCGCYWHVSDADLPDRGAASRAAALATLSGEAHDRRLLDVCNALATARFLGRPHRWCGDAPHVVALNLIPQLALGPGTALRILGRNVPGFRVYEGTGGNAFHVEAVFPEAVQRRLLAILGTEAGVSAIVRHGRGWRGTGPDWAG